MFIEIWRYLNCVKLNNDCTERKAFKCKKKYVEFDDAILEQSKKLTQ